MQGWSLLRMLTMPKQKTISTKPIAELIEQINLVAYSSNTARELKPSQWAALRYFDTAASHVRTVSGFAEMNWTTNSSASQTVSTLVSRNYLERIPNLTDRRRHTLCVTEIGKQLLETDPIYEISNSISRLSLAQQNQLARVITHLYQEVYKNRKVDF